MKDSNPDQRVRRRQVFYIPGYDPIHPRRYRELYRTESAAQGDITGYKIGISPGPKSDTYGWKVHGQIAGQEVSADIDVLVWSDIVRASMSDSIIGTYLQLLRTAWIYISTGTLRRLMWMRKGPVIAALYPVGMLLAQLAAAILGGLFAAAVVTRALLFLGDLLIRGLEQVSASQWLFNGLVMIGGVVLTLSYWLVLVTVAVLLLRWFKSKDNKLYAYYLMHDFAYSARWKGAYDAALEDRMKVFGDKIATALQSGVDEVLVVGHSSGAHLAISILADLIRGGRVRADGPSLSLLTLGQVVPMVSFLPKAARLRADLAYLSLQSRITWVDVTAPGDGCSFALCDPVAVTGVVMKGKLWPLVISAAFTQSLSAAKWKSLRWRFFRLHFQYLCAFDQPLDYDYFQITAGPQTLADRYRDRTPSKSRIDVAASKYTSTAL